MFQRSWVQFLSAMVFTLARALQLAEMRWRMKRAVRTWRSPAGRSSGACKAPSNRNCIPERSGPLGAALLGGQIVMLHSGTPLPIQLRKSSGLKCIPPEPVLSGVGGAETGDRSLAVIVASLSLNLMIKLDTKQPQHEPKQALKLNSLIVKLFVDKLRIRKED